MAADIRLSLRIHGRVQGVCYRQWSVDTAHATGLRGWVRNRRDGSVEMLVQGPEQAVRAFVDRCRAGPPAARVDRIDEAASGEEAPPGFGKKPTA